MLKVSVCTNTLTLHVTMLLSRESSFYTVPIVFTLYSCLLIFMYVFAEAVTKDETKPKRAKRGAFYSCFTFDQILFSL